MLFKSIVPNYNYFLIFLHFVTTLLFFYSIKHIQSNYTFFAIVIYLSRTYWGLLEANRQLIAVMILVAAFHLYIKGQKFKFLLFSLPSIFFHETAILFLIVLYISGIKINWKISVLLWLVISYIYIRNISIGRNIFTQLMPFMTDYSKEKIEWYLLYEHPATIGYGFAFFFQKFLLSLYVVILKIRNNEKTRIDIIFFNLIFISFVFGTLFHDFGIIDYRMWYYFDVFNCLIYPYLLSDAQAIKNTYLKKLIVALYFVLSFILYTRGPKFIEAFTPYNAVFCRMEDR
jgi:hypothetical protein